MMTRSVRRGWFVVAVVLVGGVTSACGATTAAPPDQPAPSPFPPRPVTVDVAAIVPCEVFSPAQRTRLGVTRFKAGEARVDGRPSPGCTWTGSSGLGYNTQTISLGAEVAAAEPAATVIEVNGFGAVRSSPNDPLTAGRPFCQVSVDAAPGQSIRVQVGASPSSERSTEEMCRLATEATSMVMTTVVARG